MIRILVRLISLLVARPSFMARDGKRTEEVSKATIESARVVIRTTGTNGETVASWYLEGSWLVHERTTHAGRFNSFYRKG